MAARRLLILMLVLLGLSTLAAALLDPRPLRDAQDGTTGTGTGAQTETAPETEPKPRDEAQPAEDPAGKRLGVKIEIGGKVKVVPIRVGDQLALRVKWNRPGLVEIAALGLLEPVAPGAPARFDILASEQADYGIRLLEPSRLVGRIEVRAREKGASGRAKRPSKPKR